jgi:hypothetical protein
MASMSDIRKGLEVRLKTISGLRTCAVIPDAVNPPLAFVAPATDGYFANYNQSFDGLIVWQFIIRLYVSRWDGARAQDMLDPYIDATGTKSIKAAIEAQPHLPLTTGGAAVASDATVRAARGYGVYPVGNVDYAGVEFVVEVTTDS